MTSPAQQGPYTPYFDEKSRWWKLKGPTNVAAGWVREDHAQSHADDLNTAYAKGYAAGQAAQWHKAGEFPPDPIPDGYILIGYSNRKAKDEDYPLRQLACYPPKGPWTDWYGVVPNPDWWAVIPMPEKDTARWHMPVRGTQWISVEERLPPIHEEPFSEDGFVMILLQHDGWPGKYKTMKASRTIGDWAEDGSPLWFWTDEEGEIIDDDDNLITHWMPLPAPPSNS